MFKMINVKELKRQYELEPQQCMADLCEGLESKELRPENFSMRDLFEALIPNGRELLYEIQFRRGRGNRAAILEAAQAVSTGDFSNITGQIVYNKIREAYEDPSLLWPELCTTQTTEFLNGERIPGVGQIGDKAEVVEEGARYPYVGLNEEWTDTAATIKHGFIVPVTREIIVADRTSLVLSYASKGTRWASVLKEKEVLDYATGQKNNYNRNGVSLNTYLTSGAYINSQTGNALDGQANEWRALEKADLLFDAMTDPNTGEPIGIPANPTILVPSALVRTANRIVGATEVQTVDMRAQTTTIRTTGKNPYSDRQPKVLSNQYVKARTGSTSQWFYGDFKAAILWMSVWDIEATQAASNSEAEFEQDIWARHKVSYRGVGQMYEPRKLTKNDT
jgi:hypothetical protein